MRQACHTALVGALGVMLGALPATGAGAQVPIPDLRFEPRAAAATMPRPTAIEPHYAHVRLGGASSRRTADGVGVRLVFGPGFLDDDPGAPDDDAPRTRLAGLARRTEVALLAAHARESGRAHGEGLATTTFGVAADLRPLARPIGGRLDPFVSAGAGMLRTREAVLAPPFALRWPPARIERTQSRAVLLPGLGARVPVTARVALQAEARDVFAPGSRSRHDVVLGTGLRLAL